MTRDNLVNAILYNNDDWSCPDSGHCPKPYGECEECASELLHKYESSIRQGVLNLVIAKVQYELDTIPLKFEDDSLEQLYSTGVKAGYLYTIDLVKDLKEKYK